MSDIIREVDEELRREDWEKLWQRYGKYVIGAAVAAVALTAAVVGWREYDMSQRLAEGERFAGAVAKVESSESQAESAEVMAAFAGKAADGYAMLARFREALLRAESGDREAAVAVYDALAADASVDPLYQQLAVLYAVRVQADTGEPAALIARLEPLTAEGGAWRYSARELTAILHLRAGDRDTARQTYQLLADDLLAPEGLRARAAEMLRATEN